MHEPVTHTKSLNLILSQMVMISFSAAMLLFRFRTYHTGRSSHSLLRRTLLLHLFDLVILGVYHSRKRRLTKMEVVAQVAPCRFMSRT